MNGKLGVIESAVDEVNNSIEFGLSELHTSISNGFSRMEQVTR